MIWKGAHLDETMPSAWRTLENEQPHCAPAAGTIGNAAGVCSSTRFNQFISMSGATSGPGVRSDKYLETFREKLLGKIHSSHNLHRVELSEDD